MDDRRVGVSALVAALLFALPLGAPAQPIERSLAVLRAFRSLHACPSTGLHHGACPGWQVDHAVALCMGGADAVGNLAWLSVADHRFKTFVDVRECRKFARMAATAAQMPSPAHTADLTFCENYAQPGVVIDPAF